MENKVQTLNDVINSILAGHEKDAQNIEVLNSDEGIAILKYNGILVTAQLTDEETPRLRMSSDVCRCDAIEDDTEVQLDVFTELLDLNTEIDPVQVALDTSDPQNVQIVALNSVKVVDLQREEVANQFDTLVYTLPIIADVLKKYVVETA